MILDGKVVLVTGSARGLGRACALRFALEGADLVLVDLCRDLEGVPYSMGSREQLEWTAELCRREGSAVIVNSADIRDSGALERVFADAKSRFERLDGLVNSAGIAAPAGKPFYEMDEAEWQLLTDIDLTSAWRVCRLAAQAMLPRRAGSIVNIASTAGLVGYRYFAAYVSAKHGVVGLTKAAALDLAPHGIRVNALCPGSVRDDPATEGIMLSAIADALGFAADDYQTEFSKTQPSNALVEPAAVSAAAAFLVSDGSSGMTGSIVTVDGGFSSQ
jgi:NAD(P)-dependent dehydrogenase (short-subunit alcohol dehydrogenase family)